MFIKCSLIMAAPILTRVAFHHDETLGSSNFAFLPHLVTIIEHILWSLGICKPRAAFRAIGCPPDQRITILRGGIGQAFRWCRLGKRRSDVQPCSRRWGAVNYSANLVPLWPCRSRVKGLTEGVCKLLR